ncbi:MAG TPA: NAD(P)H-binding protein [Pseudonocardiaceae bacterium]|nr:NAD(P)H-binding protein [Pseudonocardiaceae bacterium]
MTGATGHVGREVVAQLVAVGEPVRALTRRPDEVDFPAGVEVVGGDLSDAATLAPALTGVRKVYLFPEAGGGPLVDSAGEAGVEHIVLLSSASAIHPEAQDPITQRHVQVELTVRESGVPWTFVRPGEFMPNMLRWAAPIKAGQPIREAYVDSPAASIHERDIAAVAVTALLDAGHQGAAYELTGPEALTIRDKVRIIGSVLGRELPFEELTPEQGKAEMSRIMPAPLVDALFGFLADHAGKVTSTVQDVTGRPPYTFEQWVTDHLAEFGG